MDAIFFPRKDYDVIVCPHRLGKKMTYTEQSDRILLNTSYNWIKGLSETYNVKIGFFAIYDDFTNENFVLAKDALKAGQIWIDEYSMAPEIQTKITTGQTITEQEFINAYNNTLLPAFRNAIGKKPVALSYAYGNQTFRDYVCPRYLGARNSDGAAQNGGTDYGVGYGSPSNVPYSFEAYKSKGSTIRWYDRAVPDSSFSAGIANVASLIDETMLNGGWLNNFTHFHSVVNDGNQSVYDQYFAMLAQKNANNEIYFAGYGEAVAYLVFRQLVQRAVMYSPIASPNDLVIRLDARNTLGVDTDLLQVPISVKFTTTGTPLANKELQSTRNLISLGNNEYIVEIPYSQFPVARIQEKHNTI